MTYNKKNAMSLVAGIIKILLLKYIPKVKKSSTSNFMKKKKKLTIVLGHICVLAYPGLLLTTAVFWQLQGSYWLKLGTSSSWAHISSSCGLEAPWLLLVTVLC